MRILVALALLCGCESGFTKEQIDRVKQEIRESYSTKHEAIEVVDVVLVKESANQLIGHVNLKAGSETASIGCTATLYPETPGDNKTLWHCQSDPDRLSHLAGAAYAVSKAKKALQQMQIYDVMMCQCADKVCAEKIDKEMTSWAKNDGMETDKDPKAWADVMTSYAKCMATAKAAR